MQGGDDRTETCSLLVNCFVGVALVVGEVRFHLKVNAARLRSKYDTLATTNASVPALHTAAPCTERWAVFACWREVHLPLVFWSGLQRDGAWQVVGNLEGQRRGVSFICTKNKEYAAKTLNRK